MQQLVDAGDARELARRAMALQCVSLDLQRQLARVSSPEELARVMGLTLLGSFACERLVVLRGTKGGHPLEIVAENGDVVPGTAMALPDLAVALAPVLSHLAPLTPIDPALSEALTEPCARLARLGFVRAAWLCVDAQVEFVVLVGPKLSGHDYDEFDTSLLQATFDAATLACSRLLLVEALEQRNAQLSSANERLLQIDDIKSAILAGVSHELRTPLTRILSHAEALQDGDFDAATAKPFIDVIRTSARDLAEHVNETLEFAQLLGGRQTLRHQLLALRPLIEEVAAAHKHGAAISGIEIVTRGDALSVYSDPGYVRMILKHLVENALKFTPGGGLVTIELAAEEAGASIFVRDTGPGIPQAARERIWRLFELGDMSLRRETEGFGLGLALAQRLAQDVGANLSLAETGTSGSVFRIHFPAASPATPHDAHADEPVRNGVTVKVPARKKR